MTRLPSSGKDIDTISPQRTDAFVYTLVTQQYATLKELRDDYSIEEAIDLYEMCLTYLYNKNNAISSLTRKE